MSKHIRQLFEMTRPDGLKFDLMSQVIERLGQDQKRQARRNFFVFGLVDIFSAMVLVSSSFYLFKLIASSGFYNYLSLLWSDGGMISLYWHELLLSLIESLPVLGLIVLLGGTLALLLSLAKTITSFKLAY